MDLYLDKVAVSKKDVLYRLLQYSLFEESENDLNEMNENAIFEYEYFEKYFTDKNREAYFIKDMKTNKLLGFAMVNTYVEKCSKGHSVAEFMVLPKYRRNKIGKKVAFEIFNRHKGNWEIKPSYNSEKAYLFWENVIKEYTTNNYKFEDGIFVFNIKNKMNGNIF